MSLPVKHDSVIYTDIKHIYGPFILLPEIRMTIANFRFRKCQLQVSYDSCINSDSKNAWFLFSFVCNKGDDKPLRLTERHFRSQMIGL